MTAARPNSQILQYFWDLASVEETVRIAAATSLISALSQESSETFKTDMDYSVKRLIRGLASSRAGARQGFAVALTEVRICAAIA